MAKNPSIKENPEAAYNQFAPQLKKAHMSQVINIGRYLRLERRTFLIATFILKGRMKISDLPTDDAIAGVQVLHTIYKEIKYKRTVPGEIILASKKKRPRISNYGGGNFFLGGCEHPVNRVSGVCMKQR